MVVLLASGKKPGRRSTLQSTRDSPRPPVNNYPTQTAGRARLHHLGLIQVYPAPESIIILHHFTYLGFIRADSLEEKP